VSFVQCSIFGFQNAHHDKVAVFVVIVIPISVNPFLLETKTFPKYQRSLVEANPPDAAVSSEN